MRLKWIFLVSILSTALFSSSQDSAENKKKWEWSGYIKNLESLSFDKRFDNLISGNLIHNRLNGKWKPTNKITAVAEFRNRLFWGEEVRSTPQFARLLRNENDKLDLQKAWIAKEAFVLHTNVERLYLDYHGAKINARVGRQRINWGIATTWNPNDIFNAYNFLDFDYEERPGSDGAKVQYDFGNEFNAEFAYAQTGKKNGKVAAIKYSYNRWNYDMQLITGWYNDHPTLGAGWAGYIKDAGFKGEVQYFFRTQDSTDHLNLVLESDYMFKKGWYVNAGFLFNNIGLTSPVANWDSINLKLSPENLMPTKWNFIISSAREFTPLLSAQVSVLYAPGTNLAIFLPSLQYNMAANLDINLVWQSFFTETANRFEAVNHRGFLRMKWNF